MHAGPSVQARHWRGHERGHYRRPKDGDKPGRPLAVPCGCWATGSGRTPGCFYACENPVGKTSIRGDTCVSRIQALSRAALGTQGRLLCPFLRPQGTPLRTCWLLSATSQEKNTKGHCPDGFSAFTCGLKCLQASL